MRRELEKILENEEFVKGLMLKETRDEAKKAIEEKGVSVTDAEMEEIYQFYSAIYEKCKKMSKEDLDKISGGKVGGFLGGVVNFLIGDSISRKTGGALDVPTIIKGVEAGVGAVGGVWKKSQKNKAKQAEYQQKMELGNQDIQKQKLALENKKQNVLIGVVGVGAIVGTGYLFRDEIKSWLKGK